jgi:UDP-glucose 4-epimerase
MSRILITGAAGFIGSTLAYKLFKNGEEVFLLDDFSYGKEDNLIFDDYSFNEEIFRYDIRDEKKLDKLFKKYKFDIVYHLAGITPLPDCQNNPVYAVDVNVKGTSVILSLCRKYGIKKLVFASTSAVYENTNIFPSVEDKVEYPSLIYPSTKYMSEQLCRAFHEAYNMSITILRFTNVYGPHIDCLRTQPPVMAYIIRELYYNRSPKMHSDGKQERDYIYVDDLIDLAIRVKDKKGFDIVNVSTETTISINEIISIIKRIMNKENIKTEYYDVSHFWSNYPELYEKPYPINEKILEHEVLKYTCLSNKHAKDNYNWSPKISIEEGLKRTIDYTCKKLEEKENER